VLGAGGQAGNAQTETGLANWAFTVIVSGLNACDRVLLTFDDENVKAGCERQTQNCPMIPLPKSPGCSAWAIRKCGALQPHQPRHRLGRILSIMGPSGSGKSTLLTSSACSTAPTCGHYELDGTDVTDLSENERARVRREKIGFVFSPFTWCRA